MPNFLCREASTTSLGRELKLTWLMLGATVAAAMLALREIVLIGIELARDGEWWPGVAIQAIFLLAFGVLVLGSIAYQVARLGYLRRRIDHVPEDGEGLSAAFRDPAAPPLTVLVPSYKEEPSVVRRTLLSAALQAYPHRRVVLLIDDPPAPRDPADVAGLAAAHRLVHDLQSQFDSADSRLAGEMAAFEERRAAGRFDPTAEATRLAALCEECARWFDVEITRHARSDHADALLCDAVLIPLRDEQRGRAARLLGTRQAAPLTEETAVAEHRRLAALFQVEFASFERKRYENLSHEPNKAMNLNSYIALMGGHFLETRIDHGTGLLLQSAPPESATLYVPDTPFVLTVDADSVLAPDYAQRLVQLMHRPGRQRLAVAQTPYSAFPSPPGLLERIAGAQTDIQYLVHQGFTRHDATFWVGANALLRKSALEDIATRHTERGHEVVKYVQDRTPIEDTESSIDLADRGWSLYNYPERLAWSATPPDFGSLLIQRRRWANGGLVILPKALRYLLRGPFGLGKAAEALLRVHYLASIAAVNIAFLLIMFGPFERNMYVAWIPLSMLPYMLAYARDLVHCGYRWTDFFRVYALNLLLLPINLGGTLRSLHQAVTGKKSAFLRTPKVVGRTGAPGGYVLAEYALLAASLIMASVHLWRGNTLAAAFGLIYVGFAMYAIVRFMGLRESAEDFLAWLSPRTADDPARPARAKLKGAGRGQVIWLERAYRGIATKHSLRTLSQGGPPGSISTRPDTALRTGTSRE